MILTIAIRNRYTFEILIQKERCDGFALFSIIRTLKEVSRQHWQGVTMTKIILIVSLVIAAMLQVYFIFTDNGGVLAYELVGLLIAFTCSMMLLTKK